MYPDTVQYKTVVCNNENMEQCGEYCKCTHVVKLARNKVTQLVLTAEGKRNYLCLFDIFYQFIDNKHLTDRTLIFLIQRVLFKIIIICPFVFSNSLGKICTFILK